MIFDTISIKCVAEVVAISIGSMFTKKSVLDATSCRKETERAKCAIKKGFCKCSHIFVVFCDCKCPLILPCDIEKFP